MSAISHHFVSGSDFSGLFSSESMPIAGLHLMSDGGVQIFMTEPPLSSSAEDLAEWNDACNVTDYLLHALENPKWIEQWHYLQKSRWEDTLEKSKSLERERMKSLLTLIPGGKTDSGE